MDEDDALDVSTWYLDSDGDGWGEDSQTTEGCESPVGYALHGGDCDDADPAYHPGASEADCTDPSDYNCDGSVGYEDLDGDGFAACEDCDDNDGDVNEDGVETCDLVDNDCDGLVDSDDPDTVGVTTWYGDADGDGHGGLGFQLEACEAAPGYVLSSDDCDDLDAASYPGASEICDLADNDCDGDVDEGVGSTFYEDADGDGSGNGSVSVTGCEAPSGYVANSQDCDDFNVSTHPGAYEICDGFDNDCDGAIDEDAINASTWYLDADGDGYGDSTSSSTACDAPTGHVDNALDCDDSSALVSPSVAELCDSTDNDCDGFIDEPDATDAATWYADTDGDGYGNLSSTARGCSQPNGYLADASDCDDTDGAVNPDGTELCDLVDNDCDGEVDEDDAADALTWYVDSDSDGYGSSSTALACVQPANHAANDQDCDDGEPTVNPGGTEGCDGLDNDCNGTVDDGFLGSGLQCPAQSCQAIVDASASTGDGTYWIDPAGGSAFEVYCDMTTDSGGWSLTYILCQDGGGDVRAPGLSHATPITPTKQSPVTSLPYSDVYAMAPTTIRYTSDFTGGMGYLFSWSNIISGPNQAQALLNGDMGSSNNNLCQTLGTPLAGSTGISCDMKMRHNNNGNETHDITTLGCVCDTWYEMIWGQIDGLGGWNGASHLDSPGWTHSPQTSDGCLLVYVR
jgi:hypothetical protein